MTVYFDVNKFGLSPQGKKDLDGLVEQSHSLKGYMIEVAGYADPTGNAEKNQVLSEKRAEAVVQYLQQVGKVPLGRTLRRSDWAKPRKLPRSLHRAVSRAAGWRSA